MRLNVGHKLSWWALGWLGLLSMLGFGLRSGFCHTFDLPRSLHSPRRPGDSQFRSLVASNNRWIALAGETATTLLAGSCFGLVYGHC